MRGSGLRCFRAELCRLILERRCLLLDVRALLAATFFVCGALSKIELPAHVVHVDQLPVGVEVEDAVHRLPHQLDVVTDNDHAAPVALQELAQPHDAVCIEVVRRLVENHGVGIAEQNARELDAPSLTAREGAERLIEHAVGQAEVVRDRCRLGFGGVPAERLEAVSEIAEALHRFLCNARIIAGHVLRGLGELLRDRAEPSRVENAVSGELLWVARARILR